MTTPNQRQTLSEFYTELQGAKKEVLNWPCGDNRAMAIDFIARGIGELVAADELWQQTDNMEAKDILTPTICVTRNLIYRPPLFLGWYRVLSFPLFHQTRPFLGRWVVSSNCYHLVCAGNLFAKPQNLKNSFYQI